MAFFETILKVIWLIFLNHRVHREHLSVIELAFGLTYHRPALSLPSPTRPTGAEQENFPDGQYFSPLFMLVFISGNRSDGVPWQNTGNRGLKSAGSERASKKIDSLILRTIPVNRLWEISLQLKKLR
ncbi:MAG: hypothetical protein V5A59_08865 [Bacteroidales bacterium]|nr:hypothetical protein [Bacteroidales bacterium]MBS3775739.1 hypothetical protein [Bacteroidales bacterium]